MLWPRYDLILLEGFKLKDDTNMFLSTMSLTFEIHVLFYRIYKQGFMAIQFLYQTLVTC